ncbi:MAG TPA: ATP-binding cassette domain-containing protein [Kofleriaceae bacterium]|nr:ATP-binding cassette domain-containing protein [Kofleriaceae bacterium]
MPQLEARDAADAPPAARAQGVQHLATPPGGPPLTIGRAGTDLVLDQPMVARRHAELRWHDGRHHLRDTGSGQGTWVNGVRLAGERALAPGDVVQIGTFQLTYDGDSLDSVDQRGAIRIDARDVVRRAGDRVLLDATTLSIEPCEFVAIVGASGAGKSTLMMALCGFQRATSGRVSINGDDLYASFDAYRSILGYVPQEDILHRTLTVERALHHAARLRLPADTTAAEIAARIADVLAAVDMTGHAGKRIDQLSGGQRKRVSIACELLADPPLLFLDEPTSGLDPGLEHRLMYTLRRLADGGRTIVLVTHATANIRVCDHIAYLAGGKLVYFGPPAQAPAFFGVDDFPAIYASTDDPDDPRESAERWQARWRASMQHRAYAVERPARAPAAPSAEQQAERARRARTYTLSRARQLAVMTRRYYELVLADRKNLALLLLQAPVIGFLLAMVSTTTGLTAGRIEAKKVVFMLAASGVWFGVINAAREICKERAVLRRERLAGVRAGPYVASKLVVLSGLVLVQGALLLAVVALRMKLPAAGVLLPGWLELYVTIALAGLAGLALGLCISAIASTPDKATSLVPIVVVPQVLFAGIMFRLHGASRLLSWLVSSRAAVDAMSATVDTNRLTDVIPLPTEPQYAHTPSILLTAWAAIALQALLFSTVAWLALRRRA